jgi:hypothetical protein
MCVYACSLPVARHLADARTECADRLYVQILLIGLLVLFATAVLIHELARLQQYAIRVHGPEAGDDAPVYAGGFVRGGNKRALAITEGLWLRRNGAHACHAASPASAPLTAHAPGRAQA